MYCPGCGSEERQLSQYCRACGLDLRVARSGLERLEPVSPLAYAQEQVGRAVAEKIRATQSPGDLKKVAEEVLPEFQKFLESPDERRLRRIRAGVIFAAIGFGGSIISFLLTMENREFIPLLLPGFVFFFIGLGIILNGIFFTIPRIPPGEEGEQLDPESLRAYAALDLQPARQSTSEIESNEAVPVRPSVTEHTTHQLVNGK